MLLRHLVCALLMAALIGACGDDGGGGDKCAEAAIDDGNACTVDACDPATGTISHELVAVDDGNACTTDACDPATGVSHTPVNVDDGNACTTDACDMTTGVTHTPVNVDDGDACTTDACDTTTGVSHTPVDVDDGNACTTDACDPATGVSHTPVNVDDGDACTTDACDMTTGAIAHTPVDIDDDNACTTDACNALTGISHTPVDVDDSDACTFDACDMTTGVGHTPIDVSDGNGCTFDSCDPVTGIDHVPVDVDDSDSCTTDSCDPSTGNVTHAAIDSDDNVACTIDACDANAGVTHTPDDSVCAAGEVCMVSGCAAAGPGDQPGGIVITEFDALSAQESVELYNPGSVPVDIGGYRLKNSAGQTAAVQGSVIVPAGGYVYGVANPSDPAQIPADAGFVYGAPGTTFALADTGDAVALINDAGFLEDFVDFRTFHTDPVTAIPASAFVGYAGSSTQLDPTKLTATLNDDALSWCISFYPALPAARSRVTETRGEANGSCSVAVLNEVYVDPPSADDGKAFIEIAAPGGSLVVAGASIFDIEGFGSSAGQNNDLPAVVPAGVRVPVDGIVVVADGLGTTGTTSVANADVIVTDADFENNGGDSIQLVTASGALLDALGHEPAGVSLAVATNAQGAMFETNTALTVQPGSSLARATASADTDNNRNDYHGDPSPTPGLPNDTVLLTVTSMSPNDTLATGSPTGITITGTDFSGGVTAKFGSNSPQPCNVSSSTTMLCTAPTNGVTQIVDVVITNPASAGAQSVTIASGFTYTGVMNETNVVTEVDFCNLQFPSSFSVQTGQSTPLIYGQIYEGGVTEAAGAPPGVLAEVGYGPSGSSPTTLTSWRFFAASYNVQVGNNDEFMGTFVAPAAGTYSFAYRFSFDNGFSFTYCDLNGAGSNAGLTFEANQLGTMTVTP